MAWRFHGFGVGIVRLVETRSRPDPAGDFPLIGNWKWHEIKGLELDIRVLAGFFLFRLLGFLVGLIVFYISATE